MTLWRKIDRDVRDIGLAARAIDDRAATNHQIMHLHSPESLGLIFSFREKPIIKSERCK